MKKVFVLFPLFLLLGINLNAENFNKKKSIQYNTPLTIDGNKSWGVKKIIHLENPIPVKFEDINEWLRKELKVNTHTLFLHQKSFTDKIGYVHHKYRQTYKGLPVEDGVFIVHTKAGEIFSANGELYSDINLSPSILISPEEAISLGKNSIEVIRWASDESNIPQPNIHVISTNEGYRCAYKTDIYAIEPFFRKWLFIDVETGEIVAERNQINHVTVPGEAHCYHHGVQTISVDSISPSEFLLRDYSRGNGIITRDLDGQSDFNLAVDFVDDDNIWDTTTDDDNSALDVHWGIGQMYDYMLATFGWDSYDNQGAIVNSYIHHPINNAVWDGTQMLFGTVNEAILKPLTALEVVAHEFMHAYSGSIVEWNSSLLETRALNESLSDIFAVIVEFNVSPSTANYFIGDQVTFTGDAFRDMEDPNALLAPDTYLGNFWSTTASHTNANVFNYFFYLLTQGGSGTNDNGDVYTVESISLEDAGDILFRAMSVYMTPSTNFMDIRVYGIQSCIDLFGPCSEQEISFTNACYAVGLGGEHIGSSIAQIQFSGDSIVNGEINFSSNTSTAMSWDWSFGDNNNSTEESPTHIYQDAGTFEVTLSTTYANGCTASNTLIITVVDVTNTVEAIKSNILIYPNPASKNIFIELKGGQKINKIRAINSLGQYINIASYNNLAVNKYEINFEGNHSGIHFLEIEAEDGTFVYTKFYLEI